ncbi:MAG TPA: hypothetical protein VN711_01810 [Candidatus Saccharimonadales bacterium]|nr:hypothetical protein [Candidatus Saccharimonadales bacterium]
MSESPEHPLQRNPNDKRRPPRRSVVVQSLDNTVSYLNPNKHPVIATALWLGTTVFVVLSPRFLGTTQDVWLGITAAATLSGGIVGGLLDIARKALHNVPPPRRRF